MFVHLYAVCKCSYCSLLGPVSLDTEGLFPPGNQLYWGIRAVIAEFDEGLLGFPIQKLILGKEAFDLFNRGRNSDFVAAILTRKLTDFLEGTRAHIELVDGKQNTSHSVVNIE